MPEDIEKLISEIENQIEPENPEFNIAIIEGLKDIRDGRTLTLEEAKTAFNLNEQ